MLLLFLGSILRAPQIPVTELFSRDNHLLDKQSLPGSHTVKRPLDCLGERFTLILLQILPPFGFVICTYFEDKWLWKLWPFLFGLSLHPQPQLISMLLFPHDECLVGKLFSKQ